MTIEFEPDVRRAALTSSPVLDHSRESTGLPFPSFTSALAPSPSDGRAEDQAPIGRLVSGRYRIESLIARGTSSTLYCALDLIRQERCAIKLLRPPELGGQLPQRSRIEREAARRLFHPNIVSIYEYGEDDAGMPFLVMEFLPGRSLKSLLQEVGALPFGRALEILREVGAALEYMHSQGLVHLSLRPDHVFLLPRGGEPGRDAVKLIGFSQTQLIGAEGVPPGALDAGAGRELSAAYQAPELTLARKCSCDASADQWSLAVLAYRLFSGREPFVHSDPHKLGWLIRQEEPTPLHQLCPSLPAHVCHAVQMALTKRREHRFERVFDFIRALDHRPSLVEPRPSQAVLDRPVMREGREVLQTVQCLRADLIAMTKGSEPPAPVPEPIEADIPTERYSNLVLSEALRRSSDDSLDVESAAKPALSHRAPSLGRADPDPVPLPPVGESRNGRQSSPAQRSRFSAAQLLASAIGRLPFDRQRPLHWAVAAFSIVLAFGTLLILAHSLTVKSAALLTPLRGAPPKLSTSSSAPQGNLLATAHPSAERAGAPTLPALPGEAAAQHFEPIQPLPPVSPIENGHPAMEGCAEAVLPPAVPPPRRPAFRRGETKASAPRPVAHLAGLPPVSALQKAPNERADSLDVPELEPGSTTLSPAPAQSAFELRMQPVD